MIYTLFKMQTRGNAACIVIEIFTITANETLTCGHDKAHVKLPKRWEQDGIDGA
jgi:hypothetical protein